MFKNGFLRLTLTIMTVGIIIFFLIAFQGIYWLFIDDNPPIEHFTTPLPVTPAVVAPGDHIHMQSDYCRYTDAPALLTTWWQNVDNGSIVDVEQRETSLGAGCGKVTIKLTVPNLDPGHWKRVNLAVYHVNPLAEREARWESEPFEVLPLEAIP